MRTFRLLLLLLLAGGISLAQNITQIEYFVDSDPGYGSGTQVSGFTAGSVVNDVNFTVPVGSISQGLHRLFTRAKNANGKWSMVSNQLFYKDVFAAADVLPNINKVEYFIDSDPGYGAATNVPVTAGATINDLSFTVPLSNALTQGIHRLLVRARNVNGKWSFVSNQLFYKEIVLTGGGVTPPNIVKLEYFVDTDPGYGSATDVPVTAAVTLNDVNFTVPIPSLTIGLHRIFVRAKNANGQWSIVSNQLFYKDAFTGNEALPNITKVEYFVDSDPGFGSGTDVPITAGANVYDLAFGIPVTSLSDGLHKLFIRAKNAEGKWSIVTIKDFSKQPNGIALTDFPATWCRDNTITALFTSVSAFSPSNMFKVQISNNDGSFSSDLNERIIGSITSNAASGAIPIKIPADWGLPAGNYKVRLLATNPEVPAGVNLFSEEIPFVLSDVCPCPSADLSASSAVTQQILCYGAATAKILVTGTGGKAPYKYKIGNGAYQANPAFGNLAAGNYLITVRDVNWCETTTNLTITQPTVISFGAHTITNVTCRDGNDGKIVVAASGGTGALTYSLNGGAFQSSNTFSGLVAGTYTVTAKDANACTKMSGTINVTQPPALSSALSGGGGPPICVGSSLNLVVTITNGTAPFTVKYTDGTTTYTANGYTSGSNIAVTPLVTSTYTLVSVTDSKGCTSPTLTGSAIINVVPLPTVSNAGADQTGSATCGLTTVTLAANTPTIGTGQWSIVSGTGGSFGAATSPTSTFSGTAGVSYVLKWTISNAPCNASEDQVTIKFNQLPTAANAGADQNGAATCGLTTVTLAGNTPTIGTGQWSIVSGTGGSFGAATSPTSTFSGTAGVSYVLKWTISNAPCTASEDQVTIKLNQIPTVANAGADQNSSATCGLTTVTLAGNTPAIGTGQWSIVSGTGGSFGAATSPTSTFSGTAGVSYVLKWTISNAPCAASEDQVTIKFNQLPTAANAGADQNGAATCGLTTVTLAGNTPTIGTGQWSIVSGTGGSFGAATSPTSTFSGTAGVSYVLKWTISNAPCTASEDQVTIKFNQLPTAANAGADQNGAATCGLTTVTLAGNTPTIGTGQWSIVSGTGGSFGAATSPTSTFSGTAGVSYVLKWTISNAPCAASEDQVTIKFNQLPTAANAGADQTSLVTCGLTTVTLAANTPTIGTGQWSIVSGTGGSFGAATSPTSTFSGTAGVSYVLKWTISNAPCAASEDQVMIEFGNNLSLAVNGDQKSAFIPDNVNYNLVGPECRIIATVKGAALSNGVTPFKASVIIDDIVKTYEGKPYVQRHFEFLPGGTNPTSATLTLYASQAEFNAFNAASTVKLPQDAADADNYKDKIRIWQWHETAITGEPDAVIDPDNDKIVWDASIGAWKITFAIAGFSTFYITADKALPLPVTLLDFSAKKQEQTVLLNWQTTEETNSDHFEIERSIDAKNWKKIGELTAAGENKGLVKYSFTDDLSSFQVPSSSLYYRLRMVDRDNSYAYSKIASVKFESSISSVVYPNPVVDVIRLNYTGLLPKVTLTDLKGVAIHVSTEQSAPGQLTIKASSKLVPGLYILTADYEGKKISHKVVVAD